METELQIIARILAQIAWPRDGTADETKTLQDFAHEIRRSFTLESVASIPDRYER